jgi:hypothetical protein
MLDWLFPPMCPCDPAAKAWVEERLQWLESEFDDHAYNGRPAVLPTREFFPDPYNGSDESVRVLLDRVCGYMDVVPDLVELRFIMDASVPMFVNNSGEYLAPSAAGTFEEGEQKYIITMNRAHMGSAMDLVGTMAHELAHVRLLGESRASSKEYDNELLTDLTVVFFGLGLFLANSTRNWDLKSKRWPGTRLYKPEYMTPPMYASALAHLALFRGETWPKWANLLHWNARGEFKQAVRFLFKTGESEFKPVKDR